MLSNYTRYIRNIPVNYFLPVAFWALVGIIYLPAYKAGFFLDFTDMLHLHGQQSFAEFLNREGIVHKSLYQVTQFLLYILVKVFGTHPIPWFALFTSLHALNGFFIYRFFSRYFSELNYGNARPAALLGAVLFLISPVQSEVVIWKASFHYLTGLLMILLILSWTLSYLQTRHNRYIWQILILYFISTFALEMFYLTPAFVLVLIISLNISGAADIQAFKRTFGRIFIPLIAIWSIHLLLYHLVYKKWISHYDVNIGQAFTVDQILTKVNKYFLHVYGMEYFWKHEWRTKAYELAGETSLLVATGALILLVLLLSMFRFRFLRPASKALTVLLCLALLSFIIILPMWFNDMQLMRNDRYYYLPSVFMFMLLSVLLFRIRIPWVTYVVAGFYIVVCLWGTVAIVLKARQAAKIFHGMIHHFYWHHAGRVLLLNLPNNYEGIGIIPATEPDFLNTHLKVYARDTIKGKVYDVSSYNVQNPWDGAHVTVLDSVQLKVTLNQWGCWWWFRSHGATDYENELFEVKMTDPGHEYHLRFKEKPDTSTVILYQQGDQWRRVDMSRINEEQW